MFFWKWPQGYMCINKMIFLKDILKYFFFKISMSDAIILVIKCS